MFSKSGLGLETLLVTDQTGSSGRMEMEEKIKSLIGKRHCFVLDSVFKIPEICRWLIEKVGLWVNLTCIQGTVTPIEPIVHAVYGYSATPSRARQKIAKLFLVSGFPN